MRSSKSACFVIVVTVLALTASVVAQIQSGGFTATSNSAFDFSLATTFKVPNASIMPAYLGAGTVTTLTDASTVTWAIGSVLNQVAMLTFTTHGGSRTLNITSPVVSGNYILKLKQDGTGGEGLVLGTGCTWLVANGGSGAVTLSTGAGALDTLDFVYDGTNCLANLLPNLD